MPNDQFPGVIRSSQVTINTEHVCDNFGFDGFIGWIQMGSSPFVLGSFAALPRRVEFTQEGSPPHEKTSGLGSVSTLMRKCSRRVADDDWARMCELAMRAPISHTVGSSFYKTKLAADTPIVVDVDGGGLPVQFVRCETAEGSESWMSCCVCCDRLSWCL